MMVFISEIVIFNTDLESLTMLLDPKRNKLIQKLFLPKSFPYIPVYLLFVKWKKLGRLAALR